MIEQETVLRRFAAAVEDAHAQLTELDQRSGDGDFGDNLRTGVPTAVARFDADGGSALGALGEVFLDEVGGTSGPLFGLLFTEIARGLAESDDLAGFRAGAGAGLAAIQRVGEAEVGYRALVDALTPAVDAAEQGFVAAARAAAEGAAGTARLRARMGRASYVGERVLGEPDRGALGIALLFWAFAAAPEPADAPAAPLPR
ncbi:DAK2 domain-containing protein [Saccharopolyspora sp. 6T]|uniref:DAK2 domain-containing protein n=1 Tax=Saccharopolyspora sp. 6T TaxID=2877238 RepID=UPI001CD63DDA|nr:DAK2 domain-containing protein [Saccharopolyspora sp. 6T]MCA1188971.1 DAK2 domain-containing protein [Saccharopolyspora sp. 6T]